MKNSHFHWVILFFLLIFFPKIFASVISINNDTYWSQISVGINDEIIIQSRAILTIDVANAICSNIQLGKEHGNGDGSINFNSNSTLTVSGIINIGGNRSVGNIDMNNGGKIICSGITVNNAGTWIPGSGTIEFVNKNTLPSSF